MVADLIDRISAAAFSSEQLQVAIELDCIEKEMHDEHSSQVQKLLERAGIDDVEASEFRRYGSAITTITRPAWIPRASPPRIRSWLRAWTPWWGAGDLPTTCGR